jgi:hypothetical protein
MPLQHRATGFELTQGRVFVTPGGVDPDQCSMGRLGSRIRGEQPFRELFAGRFIRGPGFWRREAQAFHQLQSFLPEPDLMRAEPFLQTVGNDFGRKDITTVKLGGESKVRRPALGELPLEEPDVRFIRAGRQRDRFLIPLERNWCIAVGGKPSPDVGKGLAQAVSRLRIAPSRPKPFGKQFAMVASAARQDQGGKKQRGLSRCEADRLTLCGSHFETAKQPDAHDTLRIFERTGRIASSPVDLTRI